MPKLTIGTQFKITGNMYKQNGRLRTLEVTQINESTFDFTDAEDVGNKNATPETMSFDGLAFYESQSAVKIVSNVVDFPVKSQPLKKAA